MSQPDRTAAPRRGPDWRGLLPVVGTLALLGYMAASTDFAAIAAAFADADIARAGVVLVLGTFVTWLADTACMRWLLQRALPAADAGSDRLRFRDLAGLKAASYVLNIVNYNAATLGMGWVVARRRGVSFARGAAALAVLSWLDLVALAALVTIGMAVAPDLLGSDARLQATLRGLTWIVPLGALAVVVVARLRERLPFVARLATEPAADAGLLHRIAHRITRLGLDALAPLGSLGAGAIAVGVALRAGFVMLYVVLNHALMQSFGMTPELGALMVLIPVMTVVGVLPLSLSGIGTTQILARTLYARFVPAGVAVAPLVDAYTTALIFGFMLVRLVVAAPFVATIGAELRTAADGPADEAAQR